MKPKKLTQGFTLLEILLVVGIIAILAGIVIVAINPSKQLAQVRNTERKSDIKQLDSAITQYYIDNFEYPSDIDGTLTGICNTGSLSTTTGSDITCTNLVDLTVLVPDYITAIPTDPQSTTTNTGYYVKEDSTTHKIGVQATLAELSQSIVVGMAASTTEVVGGSTCDEGCLALRDHLVAYYALDGDAADNVGSNDGVWSGTEAYAAGNGGLGQAAVFNGSSYITVPITLNGDNFTMAGWVNFSNSNNNMILRLGDSDSPSLEIYGGWPDGSGFGAWTNPSGSRIQISNINNGAWHYVAVTVDMNTGTVYLYVDGQVRGGTDYYSSISGISQLAIGASVQGSVSSYLTGKIQHVGVWDKVLTDLEIADLYFEGNGYSLVQ